MTRELQKSEWKIFFDGLSRDLADWDTTVHILNDDSGAQILSEGLPFNGLTFNEKKDGDTITLTVGAGIENHQTHNVFHPTKVAFAGRGRGPAGTLDIEDAQGNTTLVTFIQPRRVLIEFAETDLTAV